jgi:lysozyme family protein
MIDNFLPCDAFTSAAEGGFTCDSQDPGNWTGGEIGAGVLKGTKYGISAAQYPNADIANLTPAEAAQLRKGDYWVAVKGDVLPIGVVMVYDFGVNAGPAKSVMELEKVLGTDPDGVIGPNDEGALKRADPVKLIGQLQAAHDAHYAASPLFARFGSGWDGRASRCHADALAMAAKVAQAA